MNALKVKHHPREGGPGVGVPLLPLFHLPLGRLIRGGGLGCLLCYAGAYGGPGSGSVDDGAGRLGPGGRGHYTLDHLPLSWRRLAVGLFSQQLGVGAALLGALEGSRRGSHGRIGDIGIVGERDPSSCRHGRELDWGGR